MHGFFSNFLVPRCEKVFFSFTVERILGELPKGLLLVDVGAPNDYCALIVMSLHLRRFKSADHSS